LKKDKLVVLGHSWGTVIGVHLAKDHPVLEEPGRFLATLLAQVLPFTEGSPEIAPWRR
jgi:pimeloyl-ACP methyl ester carboxylesterase